MNKLIPAILAVALTTLPMAAFSGELVSSPTAPGMPMPPGSAQMESQMHALHVQARTAVLQAISPQHRQLLAQVVGALAIAPDPDYAAAARQLDAALSQQEAQAVVRISSQFHQQMHTLMQAHVRQMESNEQNEPGESGAKVHTQVHTEGGGPERMDAGECLLMLAQSGMHGMHRVMIEKTVTH